MQARLLIVAPLALLLFLASPAGARRIPVLPGQTHLSQALATSQPGDTLHLPPGELRVGGLRLPDGITLLGDPAGTVLKAKGRQSLFVIEGATVGVTLANLEIKGARSREAGGAILARDSRLTLRGVTIRDCRSTQEGGVLFAEGGRLEITDCQFIDNRAKRGGAIALEHGEAAEGTCRLVADNVLFVGNRAATGGALASEVPVVVTHGTFVCNRAEAGPVCETQDSLSLRNCSLTGNANARAGLGLVGAAGASLDIRFTNLHGNIGGDWVGELAALAGTAGNRSVEPGFVSPDNGDFRLRWDSPLLDIGDPDAPLDFDLTRTDIGWQPKYPVISFGGGTITSTVNLANPELGWYEFETDAKIEGNIVPGSVFKVGDGNCLVIQGTAQLDHIYQVGAVDQPRTAIVGRNRVLGQPASSIEITSRGIEPDHSLALAGVVFNYPPIGNSGDPEDLGSVIQFTGWGSDTQAGLELSPETVQFLNYRSTSWVEEGETYTYDGGVVVSESTGLVHDMDFGLPESGNPTFLQAFSSRLDVEDCTFTPGLSANTAETPSLRIHSTRPGLESQLHGNVFQSWNGRYSTMLDLSMSVVDLNQNQFVDAHNHPLVLTSSTVHANSEARNHFEGSSAEFLPNQPLITMEGGFLDMYCGRNNLVHPRANEDTPVIYWVPDASGPPVADAYWRENYWGYECDREIPIEDLNDPDSGFLPDWAHVEDNLSVCLPQTAPPNPYCPFYGDTPFDLLSDGKAAELRNDFGISQLNYSAVLVLHCVSKEANEATLRLKALGLHKAYGAENHVSVRDDLFQARDISRASNMKRQAVLQGCSGWCVEARWGNRPAALDTLNAWYAKETDQLNKDTIKLALLEIATYPVPGQLSAAGPDAQMASAIVQQEAVNALLNFKRGQGSDEEDSWVLPQTFQISNLYPNPFNSRTTLVLQVPEESRVQVEVYNLLGQLVGTLHDGVLPAGEHRLVADGENWSSGLYFVTATSAGKVQVRKMLLVK